MQPVSILCYFQHLLVVELLKIHADRRQTIETGEALVDGKELLRTFERPETSTRFSVRDAKKIRVAMWIKGMNPEEEPGRDEVVVVGERARKGCPCCPVARPDASTSTSASP